MQIQQTETRQTTDHHHGSRSSRLERPHAQGVHKTGWAAWRRAALSPVLLIAVIFGSTFGLLAGSWVCRSDSGALWQRWSGWLLAEGAGHDGEDGGAEDDHHDDPISLELSEQARKNIGLTVSDVSARDFARSIMVPGIIGERPGQTLVTVSAPVSGVVRRIVPLRGESIAPGTVLFDIGLTHENLVDRQRALLLAVEQLNVVQREVARLDEATSSGAVAGRLRLEREYERQTVEATIHAETQALMLHGFSHEQVQEVMRSRRLLSSLSVSAPPLSAGEHHSQSYHVVELKVHPGDFVEAGAPLALLADHCELYVEGRAFERDAAVLHRAVEEGVGVGVLVETADGGKQEVYPLEILYVENEVDRASRALKFFVRLPNEIVRDTHTPDGRRFHAWRFKPGQRVELQVPVEWWPGRMVLPIDAVVREGVDWFVYRERDGKFHRTPVHVEHRDQRWSVVSADGELTAGDVVAVHGAYQIHLALKQQADGGHDPHAGHHH